jgi:hypothetical protein
MSQASTPYGQLQALAATLSSPPYQEQVDSIRNNLDVAALTELVITTKSGTQSQFATAFALMARSQGFPTRLVVGYSTRGKGKTRTVESTDVIIYPEVELTKVGWVPFAPGPRDLARGVPVIRRFKPPAEPTSPPETPTPSPEEPTPSPSPTPEPEQTETTNWAALVAPAIVLLLLLAWPLIVAWRRTRVRRSYRGGSSDEQVTGAWSFTRVSRRRLGQPLDETVSPAHYAADPAGEPRLIPLAALTETAMYAPEELQPADADRAWELSDKAVDAAVRKASWTRRLRWWLVPQRRN